MLNLVERYLTDVPIVVLDTETTGLHPGLGHRIVEIGALRLEPGLLGSWQEQHSFSRLVNPGRMMDPAASRVNGIYDADLVNAPPLEVVVGELLDMLNGAVMVAHNAYFDADFLAMELYILSLTNPDIDPVLPNPWICTLQLARNHFHFGRNNLGHVARMLGVRSGRAHRAMNDVYMTAEVFKRMARELAGQRLETVGDLLHAQGGAIYTPPPPQVRLPEPLDGALATGQSLRIHYLGRSGETERIIEPLYVGEYAGQIYVIAYCHLRNDQRTFRLDGILSAEVASS